MFHVRSRVWRFWPLRVTLPVSGSLSLTQYFQIRFMELEGGLSYSFLLRRQKRINQELLRQIKIVKVKLVNDTTRNIFTEKTPIINHWTLLSEDSFRYCMDVVTCVNKVWKPPDPSSQSGVSTLYFSLNWICVNAKSMIRTLDTSGSRDKCRPLHGIPRNVNGVLWNPNPDSFFVTE